jgi:hypothetical protein
MVTLFSDRIPLAILFQIAWRRQSLRLRKRQSNPDRPVSPAKPPGWVETDAIPSVVRPRGADRKHGAPSLSRLRHVWYRDAVAHDAIYDSYYFIRTGEWVEPRCADPLCAWCRDRPRRHPEKPILPVPEWLTKDNCVPGWQNLPT